MELIGHNTEDIVRGLDFLVNTNISPAILIAHTIKGKGVSYMEDIQRFGAAPNDEQFKLLWKNWVRVMAYEQNGCN